MRSILAMAAAAAVLVSGCIGSTQEGAPSTLPVGPAPGAVAEALEAATFAFEGHLVVGAALEAPAHLGDTEPLVEPLWKSGFVLEVTEPPQDLQVALDWTGADASRMQLMLHGPHGDDGWPEWQTEFSDAKHQCIRVPVEDLLPGHWQFMVHSLVSADVEYTITARVLGGAAEAHDMPHGHGTSEFPFKIYEREELPCDEAA